MAHSAPHRMQEPNGTIRVMLEGHGVQQWPRHTRVRDLIPNSLSENGLHYMGAVVNNDVVSLSYPLEVDSAVRLITLTDPHGWRIYRRSVSFLLAKTVKELYPHTPFAIEHSLGTGFYCTFQPEGRSGIDPGTLNRIEERMRELVGQDIPIERSKIAFQDAIQRFEDEEQRDKYNLLRFRNPPKIVIYSCDGFSDLAHGPLADSTGALGYFKLIPYEPGFVILFPEREHAPLLPPFEKQPHLFQIFKEHKEWGRILGVRTVGDLNEINANHGMPDFIKIAEAFHEKKIAKIADIVAERKDTRLILVAGPSSSGKTTFAKRLAIQLRVNGLRPMTVSVDHYFVDRVKTPRDEDGQYDFEHIETIDLTLFNEHLLDLAAGKAVQLPRFDFEKGVREYRGEALRIEPDQLLIVEGIHGLNPKLTEALPGTQKFKIYVSALTQLNIDLHNRMSTTDNRLIRRIVRDSMFRGSNALSTLEMWPSVRRGEKSWIFPFQQEADIAFNSALDYELAVLKSFVEPVLAEVKPTHAPYAEARRLMDFLESFLFVPAELVPATSILREFIGKSGFQY